MFVQSFEDEISTIREICNNEQFKDRLYSLNEQIWKINKGKPLLEQDNGFCGIEARLSDHLRMFSGPRQMEWGESIPKAAGEIVRTSCSISAGKANIPISEYRWHSDWEEKNILTGQTAYGGYRLALFPSGGQAGIGYQVFGANITVGDVSLCYCLRRCCSESGSKIEMAVKLLNTLPQTGAQIIIQTDSWYALQGLGKESYANRSFENQSHSLP